MSNIVKNTTFPSLLDLLAPHSCRGCGRIGNVLCNRCKNNIILDYSNFCPNCKTKISSSRCKKCKSLPPIFTISTLSDLMGTLIHDFKYNFNRSLAKPLAGIIHHTLPVIDGPAVVVPLPTISRHVRERGLDHTYLIAKHFAKLSHYQTQKLLIRTNNTVQVGSSRKDRITQASAAYQLSPKAKISPDTTYILFDDVWTTGASMKSAIKKLRQAGAKKIIVAVLAVSSIN